jgi:hypothetical protein
MWVFRDPFDLETIERLGEVRAALGSMGPPTADPKRLTPAR